MDRKPGTSRTVGRAVVFVSIVGCILAVVLLRPDADQAKASSELPPLNVELSKVRGVSLVRVDPSKQSGSSSMQRSGPTKASIRETRGTLIGFLLEASNGRDPIIQRAQLPGGDYAIKAHADIGGDRRLVQMICEAYSKAFDIWVSRRAIETEVTVLTCPDPSKLKLKRADGSRSTRGFHNVVELGDHRLGYEFSAEIGHLATHASTVFRQASSAGRKGATATWPAKVFVDETNLEGTFKGTIEHSSVDPRVVEQSLCKMGFTLTPAKRKVIAIVIEPKVPGKKREYLLDLSRPMSAPPLELPLRVRIYKNPEEAPDDFVTIMGTAKVEREVREKDTDGKPVMRNTTIVMPTIHPSMPSTAMAVVVPMDQDDQEAVELIDQRLYVWPATHRRPTKFPMHSHTAPIVFKDAVGRPIAGASITATAKHDPYGSEVQLTDLRTGRDGRIGLRRHCVYALDIRHPDYGHIQFERLGLDKGEGFLLPVVSTQSDEYTRALRGVVIDPDGKPVAGARVRIRVIYLRSGAWQGFASTMGRVVTDAEGRFATYPVGSRLGGGTRHRVPPDAVYEVSIQAPESLRLFVHQGKHPVDRDLRITMERGTHFHRLAFETLDGALTDPSVLRKVSLWVNRPDRPRLHLASDFWMGGAKLPLGTYEASIYTDKRICFGPVEITEDTPEHVVFREPAGLRYRGRVNDATTRRPLVGAFITAGDRRQGAARITDEQWQALHDLPMCPGSQVVARVIRWVVGGPVVRTDRDGRFALALRWNGHCSPSITVFEEGYLPLVQRLPEKRPGAEDPVVIPSIRLCPAAKVKIHAQTDAEDAREMLWADFAVESKACPGWARVFISPGGYFRPGYAGDANGSKLRRGTWLLAPAGVPFRLRLRSLHWSEILLPETLKLKRGERRDLGTLRLEKKVTVIARVVNDLGKPVHGLHVSYVHMRDGAKLRSSSGHTNQKGRCEFTVDTYSQGMIVVAGRHYQHASEVPLEVGGPEDGGREFKVVASYELLKALGK